MKIHEATEQAYKNGYAKGFADGKASKLAKVTGDKCITKKAISILIELLRVFINAPYRPKANAIILEAKLDELKEELESNLEVK